MGFSYKGTEMPAQSSKICLKLTEAVSEFVRSAKKSQIAVCRMFPVVFLWLGNTREAETHQESAAFAGQAV